MTTLLQGEGDNPFTRPCRWCGLLIFEDADPRLSINFPMLSISSRTVGQTSEAPVKTCSAGSKQPRWPHGGDLKYVSADLILTCDAPE